MSWNSKIIELISLHAEDDKDEYQKFFKSALDKFGIKSPTELGDDKKKEFFNYIDKGYDAKNEGTMNENPAVIATAARIAIQNAQGKKVSVNTARQKDYREKDPKAHKKASSIFDKIKDKFKSKKKPQSKGQKLKTTNDPKPSKSDAQKYSDLYGGGAKVESTKAYAQTLAKMAKDRQLKNISKKDKDMLMKIAQMMKTANEGALSSKIKKAIMIAIQMSGNMTGAVDKIEKIAKGLSKDKKVAGALRLANEGKINEDIDKAYDNLHTALVYVDKVLSKHSDKKAFRAFKKWWNQLDNFYPAMYGEIKEDLDPYKNFGTDNNWERNYDLNLGAFVEHYQDLVKFMKKHKPVPDKNKRAWANAIRAKVGRPMLNGHMSQMSNIMNLLKMGEKFRNLPDKAGWVMGESINEAPVSNSEAKKAIKNFLDKALKLAGIKVLKHQEMKPGTTRAVYGCFYTVKAASGNDVLPFYVYKNGKIELGVSSKGFWPGKYGELNKVVKQLKHFKSTDLDKG
tara:strand:- start:1084 stop:2616 length:1533 start_codon:yes stop_codon:yes gene_type:complete